MAPKTKRKPKAPGAKPCKPRPLYLDKFNVYRAEDFDDPRLARRIAGFLLKVADWADAQAARRKGERP